MQPALKCRGREYLRIIYGPVYTAPENLECLIQRSFLATGLCPLGSSLWELKDWKGLLMLSRFAGFMNVCLEFWFLKASLLIQGYEANRDYSYSLSFCRVTIFYDKHTDNKPPYSSPSHRRYDMDLLMLQNI